MKLNVILFCPPVFPWQHFDRTHQCLKRGISDSKSPSNFCIKCRSHFCVSLICLEYAYQLHILASDTYVSKMCSSWVIIEMVIRKCSKKHRQLYLALLGCESSKYTTIKHCGTKCANMHLSIHLFSFFLSVHICKCKAFICMWACVIVCALRHSNPCKLTADSKGNI